MKNLLIFIIFQTTFSFANAQIEYLSKRPPSGVNSKTQDSTLLALTNKKELFFPIAIKVKTISKNKYKGFVLKIDSLKITMTYDWSLRSLNPDAVARTIPYSEIDILQLRKVYQPVIKAFKGGVIGIEKFAYSDSGPGEILFLGLFGAGVGSIVSVFSKKVMKEYTIKGNPELFYSCKLELENYFYLGYYPF